MSKRRVFLVLPVAAALALSACGGGDVGGDDDGGGGIERPSVDEVVAVMTEGSAELAEPIPAEQLDCVAEFLVESDLDDETLRAMVDGTTADGSAFEPDDAALAAIAEATQGAQGECIPG